MSSVPELQDFHLPNAPIVEAMIEIKLMEPLPQDALQALQECAVGLKEVYPSRDDLMVQQFQVQIGVGPSQSDAPMKMGFLCKDASEHRVVHLKLDGFGLSELKPYTSWDEFFPEAKRIWEAYRLAIGGAQIGSWSIRYINQISWPADARMEDYLSVYPTLSTGLPQPLISCFMRLQSTLEEPTEGVFTQQIFQVASPEVGKVCFIVDHTFMFSSSGVTDPVLWERIDLARTVKNASFKATFTERALEMFQ